VSVVAPKGFAAAGGHVGIKPGSTADCAVVAVTTDRPASAAGVFTTNLAAAAPVQVSRSHLRTSGGLARAIVVTSGNANAATGPAGIDRALGLCATVGGALGAPTDQVLVAQTGLIGVSFAFESCEPGVAALCAAATATEECAAAAATAILTTDTGPKTFERAYDGFTLGAMAKGAAMLAPNLATMLCVLTTDAACEPDVLARLLRAAVEPTFNRVLVDGDPSTNDTVFALSSGVTGPVPAARLGEALEDACGSLARQMVDDAEGATKTAVVTVTGAASDDDAHRGARAVAGSLLVKCSLNGADPYWGRVVAALGAAGIDFSIDRVRIAYGDTVVCDGGIAIGHDAAALASHLGARIVELRCELGLGSGTSSMLCCDLGPGYLDENRTTS
jgi:glutamate N-acetyltransferase / amino-acid N-acetyltransferase